MSFSSTISSGSGEERKEDGMQSAMEHANAQFKREARAVVEALCINLEEFTTNDVWDMLELADVHTSNNSVLGGIMNKAARDGLITNTMRIDRANKPKRHAGVIAIWKSNVYRGKI